MNVDEIKAKYDPANPCHRNVSTCTMRDIASLIAEVERLNARFTAPIVCMCGSTKFKQTWITENARLTGEGNIVLSVGLWGHHERIFPAPEVKARLDNLHKRKIDLCDWVWVLDVGGYIGNSTRSEIEYAENHAKPIRYLSLEYPGYTEPIDELTAELATVKEQRDSALKDLCNCCKTYADLDGCQTDCVHCDKWHGAGRSGE